MTTLNKKRLKQEKGAAAALVAIMVPILVGGVGLIVDNGNLLAMRRDMQAAADATAITAAQELRQLNAAGFEAIALANAEENGFSPAGGASIAINRPPTSGVASGDSNYVEVVISQQAPLFFMRALGSENVNVEARAVAGLVDKEVCIYALNETDSDSFMAMHNADIDHLLCAMQVNSSNSAAAAALGNARVDAAAVNVVGDYVGTGFFPTPETGVVALDDPLGHLQPPTYGGCDYYNTQVIHTTATLNPGVYCGGIAVKCDGHATLNPGTYILRGGGLTVRGGGGGSESGVCGSASNAGVTATLIGNGVSFYNTTGGGYSYGPIRFDEHSDVTLSAPTSGDMHGVLFFQDRGVTTTYRNRMIRNADVELTGAAYFPTTDFWMQDNARVRWHSMSIVAQKFHFEDYARLQEVDRASATLAPAVMEAAVRE